VTLSAAGNFEKVADQVSGYQKKKLLTASGMFQNTSTTF
jgi:hypothetical protein